MLDKVYQNAATPLRESNGDEEHNNSKVAIGVVIQSQPTVGDFVPPVSTTTEHQPPTEALDVHGSEHAPKPTDDEIIEKAKRAKNKDKFRRLWTGDRSGYKQERDADVALCMLLGF